MSIDNTSGNAQKGVPTGAELGKMLDNGQWDQVKELIGMTPEEAEKLLSEADFVDIDIVSKRLGITDEELV